MSLRAEMDRDLNSRLSLLCAEIQKLEDMKANMKGEFGEIWDNLTKYQRQITPTEEQKDAWIDECYDMTPAEWGKLNDHKQYVTTKSALYVEGKKRRYFTSAKGAKLVDELNKANLRSDSDDLINRVNEYLLLFRDGQPIPRYVPPNARTACPSGQGHKRRSAGGSTT